MHHLYFSINRFDITAIVHDLPISQTMGRLHNPSDSGIDMQLGDSVAEVMNANRSPEPHRTVAQEPELAPVHTDGYPVSGDMDDIVARLREMLDGPVPYTAEPQDLRDAIAEIERLRTIIQNYIKAEQDMNHASTDYFALDYHNEMAEALETWKNAYQALENEIQP